MGTEIRHVCPNDIRTPDRPWELEAFRPLRMLRLREVLDVVDMTRSSWERAVRSGVAPQRVHLGPDTTRWRARDIDEFLGVAKEGPPMMVRLLSSRDVSELLSISTAAWREWVRDGRAPGAFNLGEKLQRWRPVDIAAFIDERAACGRAIRAVLRELDRALQEHPMPESPTEALMAIRGEVDEVACAISVGDMTGPHGYMAELPQVAAVAVKALMGHFLSMKGSADEDL